MTDLWPEDITSDDVLGPQEILEGQAKELADRTGSLLKAHVTRQEMEDRIELGFEVQSERTDNRVRLFVVQHRLEFEYPVTIVPPPSLPDYLKQHVYRSGMLDTVKAFQREGGWVENEWVASSPRNFETKLQKVLALYEVKAMVLSLLASAKAADSRDDGESDA